MSTSSRETPNIVYILADDLGYGDLGCYNPGSKIPTPNLDRLAGQGRRFTDAHAPSAFCTPTRYSVMTGRYCWRTGLQENVLWPWDPPLIDADRSTIADLLGQHGYQTACIGKWHLGWEWPTHDGDPAHGDVPMGEYARERRIQLADNIDFTGSLSGGPIDRGFDYYFGDDVPNFPPYTWIENDEILERPIVEKPDEMFGLPGPMARGWVLESVMPTLTKRAVEYIEDAGDDPFFLYFPLTAPHTPIVPTEQFRGQSDAGEYGDYVCEVDWTVGQILNVLEREDIADDTLVIFTSDNGPEQFAYERIQNHGHYSMDGFRGLKRDTWEGGHRVPFIARWPSVIPAGTTSAETICQTDLMATVASILNVELPEDVGQDSHDIMPALRGDSLDDPIREATILHGHDGNLAIRKDEWVLIDAPTGDVSGEPQWFKNERGYHDHDQPGELYNLSDDPAQRHNLYEQRPEKVNELYDLLSKYRKID